VKRHELVAVISTLALIVLGLLSWNIRERVLDSGRVAGFSLSMVEEGIRLVNVSPGYPADSAGIRDGDILLGINGQEVHSFEDYDRLARGFLKGHEVHLDILRDREVLHITFLPGKKLDLLPIILVSLTVGIYFLLGIISLLQGPDDLRARLLFGFSLAVAIEMSLPVFNYGPVSAQVIAGTLFFIISGVEMALELHLAAVIPHPAPFLERNKWIVRLLYVAGIGLGLVGALTLVFNVIGVSWWPLSRQAVDMVMNNVVFPLWAFGLVFLLGHRAITSTTARGRHQAGLVLVGVLPWTIYALATSLYPPFLTMAFSQNDVLISLVLLAYPVAVFVAIFKYRLFDLERVVKRGLISVFMALILAGIFAILIISSEWIISLSGRESDRMILIAVSMLLLGILFSPIFNGVRKLVEKRFFPERSALRQRLIDLAGELPAIGSLPEMGRVLVVQLREIFAVRSVTILIKRPGSGVFIPLASTLDEGQLEGSQLNLIPADHPGLKVIGSARKPVLVRSLFRRHQDFADFLDHFGVALVLPLRQKEELIGVFLIGEREGLDRFPAEELELLNLLSHHVATSFENARLFESATYESLTGLLRREALLSKLRQEIKRAQRYERPLTVAMADLDHFKQINDLHGHLAGDALLRKVSQAMTACLRATDTVGRYGGEEFLFIFPETTIEEARFVSEKIRRSVADIRLKDRSGSHFNTTVSIGLVEFGGSPEDPEKAGTTLIGLADEALYLAKSQGRNCIRVAGESSRPDSRQD